MHRERIFQPSPEQTLRYAQGDIYVAPFKTETNCGRYFRGKAPAPEEGTGSLPLQTGVYPWDGRKSNSLSAMAPLPR